MGELSEKQRDDLIDQVANISTRLISVPDGPARDDLKAELHRLARLLWLDGKPESQDTAMPGKD